MYKYKCSLDLIDTNENENLCVTKISANKFVENLFANYSQIPCK